MESRPDSERRARRGFTLMEMLIVIALIGMFTAIFVMNFEVFVRQSESDAVESALWTAVREARTRALLERRAQTLRYDKDAVMFIVEEVGGTHAKTYAISQENWGPDTSLEVKLQKRVPPSQFTLVQGELIEMREVRAVQFFPDGTCTPFAISLEVGNDRRTIEIDPWTGAQLLKSDAS